MSLAGAIAPPGPLVYILEAGCQLQLAAGLEPREENFAVECKLCLPSPAIARSQRLRGGTLRYYRRAARRVTTASPGAGRVQVRLATASRVPWAVRAKAFPPTLLREVSLDAVTLVPRCTGRCPTLHGPSAPAAGPGSRQQLLMRRRRPRRGSLYFGSREVYYVASKALCAPQGRKGGAKRRW